MRRLQAAASALGYVLGYIVVTVTVVALAPLVLLGGELVNRHYLGPYTRVSPGRRRRAVARGHVRAVRVYWQRTGRGWVTGSFGAECHRTGVVSAAVLTNPAWIALTAPARWLLGRLRPLAGRGGDGNGPPPAGVREPRRPGPDRPAGAIALPEPRGPR